MADVFMYQAELFCRECGEHLRSTVLLPVGANVDDESTFDSNDYPKGPYSNGGGEADTPQHCGDCGEHLGNPLTPEGVAYVRKALTIYESTGQGRDLVLKVWREFYSLDSHYPDEEDCEAMEEADAIEYVPQWGSYMTSGDPGAIMYSRVPPEAPEHRDAMVRYIRGHCYGVADIVADDPDDDRTKLRQLVRYLLDLDYTSEEES